VAIMLADPGNEEDNRQPQGQARAGRIAAGS
jgi:hypothetical protein